MAAGTPSGGHFFRIDNRSASVIVRPLLK